jgi:hyperosmotically inducible periplasmic protein
MKINKNHVALSLFTAVSLAALTGCSTWQGNGHDERSAGRVVDDRQITQAVRSNLRSEPVYKFNDVHVNTFAGVVQLSGFVNSEEQKRRAGELTREVAGVAQVENALALKPHIATTNRQLSESGRHEPRIYSQPYNPDGVAEPSQGAPAKQNLQSTDQNSKTRE